jgi:hypothetical protein
MMALKDIVNSEFMKRWQSSFQAFELPGNFYADVESSVLRTAGNEEELKAALDCIFDEVSITEKLGGESEIFLAGAHLLAGNPEKLKKEIALLRSEGALVRYCSHCNAELHVPVEIADLVKKGTGNPLLSKEYPFNLEWEGFMVSRYGNYFCDSRHQWLYTED